MSLGFSELNNPNVFAKQKLILILYKHNKSTTSGSHSDFVRFFLYMRTMSLFSLHSFFDSINKCRNVV